MDYADIELIYELDYNDEGDDDGGADAHGADGLDDAWFAPSEADLVAHPTVAPAVWTHLPVFVIVASAFVVAAVGAAVF
jgi:hypothetical protein